MEIRKYTSDDSGLYLKTLADTRVELVGKLRDLGMIEEDDFALILAKNNGVARYSILEAEDEFEEKPIEDEDSLIFGLHYIRKSPIVYNYLYAHSQINKLDHPLLTYIDFVPLQDNQFFNTLVLNNKGETGTVWDRKVDTESKILEKIYKDNSQLSSVRLVVDIFTKYHPCESCMGVMNQFIEKMNESSVHVEMSVYYENTSSKQNRLKRGQVAL